MARPLSHAPNFTNRVPRTTVNKLWILQRPLQMEAGSHHAPLCRVTRGEKQRSIGFSFNLLSYFNPFKPQKKKRAGVASRFIFPSRRQKRWPLEFRRS